MSDVITFFLRPGPNVDSPMEAYIDFFGISAILLAYEDGTLFLHKQKADGSPTVKAMCNGSLRRCQRDADNAPDYVGNLVCKDGTRYELALWSHADEADPYYSGRLQLSARQGKFFEF